MTRGDTWYPIQIVGFPPNGVVEVIFEGKRPFGTIRFWNYEHAALVLRNQVEEEVFKMITACFFYMYPTVCKASLKSVI